MHAFTYYVKTFSFYSILQSIIESNLYKGRVQLFNENNKMFLCGEVVGTLEDEHESRPKRKTRSTRESNLLRWENTSKGSFASCNS